MASINEICQQVTLEVRKVIMGQDKLVESCLVAILCGGHVLLEGVPGTGKTLLMRTLAHILGIRFSRIQFTPDLMPSDVVGTNIFNFQKNEFVLKTGPIFTQFLLADEINRTPPKTQSALLEGMQEGNVTIDGVTHPLPGVFLVAATQNPIEQEGTYPLPEAQLDRFLLKLKVDYPTHQAEVDMIKNHRGVFHAKPENMNVKVLLNQENLLLIRKKVSQIIISEPVIDYIVKIVRKTRDAPMTLAGASPRAALMLTSAARSLAVIRGREYVLPDDVKELISQVLGHRIVLTPNAQIEGITVDKILQEIIDETETPR